MWQLFTERARTALHFAEEEADRLGEKYIGTEFVLLGLLRDTANTAVRVLTRLNLSADQLCSDVERELGGHHGGSAGRDKKVTPRAMRVLELAHEEAQLLRHDAVGTGHILLGLIREADGMGALVLRKRKVNLEQARQEVAELQDDEKQAAPSE
jgi:ATP-dependent Clp protease ATP-binding subunit ClpC